MYVGSNIFIDLGHGVLLWQGVDNWLSRVRVHGDGRVERNLVRVLDAELALQNIDIAWAKWVVDVLAAVAYER